MQPQQSAQLQTKLEAHPEGQMAKSELYRAAKMSIKLFQMIQDGQELEGWVQAKITKSADYLDSIYHYMEYQMKFGQGGQASSVADITDDMNMSVQASPKEEDDEDVKVKESYEQRLHALLEAKVKKSKPDFLDMDKDGDKKEPMKKAVADKKAGPKKGVNPFAEKDESVKEGFPTVAKATADAEKKKTTGKFDKKEIKPGVTQYTRKSSTFTDGGDDKDVKAAKKKAKNEGIKDIAKKAVGAVKKAGSKALDTLGHGSDEDMIKDLQKKTGMPQTGKKPMAVKNESSAARGQRIAEAAIRK